MSTNEEKWTHFLSSINIEADIFKSLPRNILKISTERNIECLATDFAEKLLQQKDENEMSAQGACGDVGKVHRNTHTPSKKNDIDKSCCNWDISNIADYVSFDCVTKIIMPPTFSPAREVIYEKAQKDIYLQLKGVRGIDLDETKFVSYSPISRRLISITTIETGSRLVLDALLVPLCSALDLEFEVEKNINCDCLPNCRFDYCIRKGERIIGCIEAKSVKSLSDSSVAQAIVELMILHTNLLSTETLEFDFSKFPVFAIVSDGHRFIYMQLKGSSLGFEYDGLQVRIRKVGQECDFKDILHHISFLVEEAVL